MKETFQKLFAIVSRSAASSLKSVIGVRIVIGVILALGMLTCVESYKAKAANRRADAAALRADSIEAVLDTTRVMKGALGDSIDVYRRRAVQHKLAEDALQAKLRSRAVQRAAMSAFIPRYLDSLKAEARADSLDEIRRALFPIDSAPFRGQIDVEIPRPPASAVARIDLSVDTARIGLSVRCGVAAKDGVNTAEIAVSTPPWLKIRVDGTEQETRVCNPQISTKQKQGPVRRYGPPALSLLVGYLLGKN
jgi:hypothetical protein